METYLCLEPHSERVSQHSGDDRHLSAEEIAAHSAGAPTTVERQRWRVLGLLANKTPVAEIEAATGYRPRTVRQIAQRYRELGPAGLADARRHRGGATPLLADAQQRELAQALRGPPPDGGVWTGPKVAEWIAARTGRRVHRQRGWEYLRRLGTGAMAAPSADDQSVAAEQAAPGAVIES